MLYTDLFGIVSGGRLRVRLVIVNMISRYEFEFEEIIALS